MEPDAVQTRLRLAMVAAEEVAARIMRVYRPSGVRFDTKADGSPVTVADRDAESHIRAKVERWFPGDGFLGEEFGEAVGNTGFRWIVDPIDGTKAFVHGVPLFGTLIAIERNGRPVAGVINLPAISGGELLYAATSEGCWHRTGDDQPQRARVSGVARLADGLVCLTCPGDFASGGLMSVYEKFGSSARQVRGWGDCFGLVMVATGRAEVCVDVRISPWDIAAAIPILAEAGGTLTDWSGKAGLGIANCITTNGKVLPEVLAITQGRTSTPAG